MSDRELPPLPAPTGYVTERGLKMLRQDDVTIMLYPHPYLIRPNETPMFTADQMRAYAAAAVAAERERCARIADEYHIGEPPEEPTAAWIAATIRGTK